MKPGYSKKTIVINIQSMMTAGYSKNQAIVHALNHARKNYFERYPLGALPFAIAYPKNHRLARFYLPNGAPVRAHENTRESNPVRELDIDDAELTRIKNDVQKQLSGKGKAIRDAAALYTDFTGHDDPRLTKVALPDLPKAMLAIGEVDGIMYSTIRDNVAEKYIHKFKSSARPLLCSSPDGKQLYLIGGSYDFTERGIVDRKP